MKGGLRPTALISALLAVALGAPSTRASAQLVRAPYLQMGTPDGVTIVWRTASPEDSVVCWGDTADALERTVTGASAVTDHAVRVDGLAPNTRGYYAVSSTGACPPGGPPDPERFFRTAPPVGERHPFTAWVVGDSGTGGSRQRLVFDAMRAEVAGEPPELFVHVGDMAYTDGTTQQFTDNFFSVYAPLLAHTVAWTAIGNHEGHTSDSATQSGPYYEAYVLPTDGAAGGLPSGTEAYYAFDYANVHFVVLDSYESPRAVDGAMLTWLAADLASTDQEWIVASWHHPPYTDGTHDSDTESYLVDMRENALPILEAAGVDVVLGGHSHIFERSYLVHGAYDTPTTAAGHVIDSGDGRPDGDGAYAATGDGALYVVAGHGGAGIGGDGAHPLMFFSELDHGSCLMEVSGGALTLRNIRWDGEETDRVTLVKGDGVFLVAPVGGERFLAGSSVDVVWVSSGTSGEVRIEHSLDGGATWSSIADRTADDGHHLFRTPRRASDRVRVRVTDVADASRSDESGDFTLAAEGDATLVPLGGVWEYWDRPEAPPSSWSTELGEWPSGPAELGYGDGDESTLLTDADPNVASAYFRRSFTVDGEVTSARLRVVYDDAFAAFVNGTPVLSQNVGDLAHDAYAASSSSDDAVLEMDIDPAAFSPGENVIAVVVKQASATSSDLSFDLSLRARVRVTLDPDPPDAGPASMDAGRDEVDAASPTMDGAVGSEPPPVDDGCGCRAAGAGGSGRGSSGAAAWLLLALGLLWLRARRRASSAVAVRFLAPIVSLAVLGGCAHDVPPASAAERARVRVVMYTTRWCPVCSSARGWFRARGIPFEERDVDGSPAAAAAHRQLNPARTVPVIDVEGQVIVGFVAEDVRRAVDRAASRN